MKVSHFVRPVIVFSLLLGSAQANALNIMLVNDDGCNAPGLTALAVTLRERGHTVSVYAPAGEQSGQGSRLSLPKGACSVRFDLQKVDLDNEPVNSADTFCIAATAVATSDSCGQDSTLPVPFISLGQTVSASPADSSWIGLNQMTGSNTPDLVISGINSGDNVGLSTVYSGTVAAAVTALRNGVPAIATSLSVRSKDFGPGATFVADLVDRLQTEAQGGPLLPPKMGLNINFPAGTPKGVIFTEIGRESTLGLAYEELGNGSLVVGLDLDLAPRDIPVEDISTEGVALREGYISISTLNGDYNATSAPQALTRLKLRGLQ